MNQPSLDEHRLELGVGNSLRAAVGTSTLPSTNVAQRWGDKLSASLTPRWPRSVRTRVRAHGLKPVLVHNGDGRVLSSSRPAALVAPDSSSPLSIRPCERGRRPAEQTSDRPRSVGVFVWLYWMEAEFPEPRPSAGRLCRFHAPCCTWGQCVVARSQAVYRLDAGGLQLPTRPSATASATVP